MLCYSNGTDNNHNLCWRAKPRYVDCGNESSWERKFHVTFAPRNESSLERKFQGAKVPSMELSFPGTKVRGNESSVILLLILEMECLFGF